MINTCLSILRTSVILIFLIISTTNCQKQKLPQIPTPTPTFRVIIPEHTVTPLIRANRIIGSYGQSLILYTGDSFTLDNLEDSIAPVLYDQSVLQLISNIDGNFTEPKMFRAIKPGITKITTTVVPPCPNKPIGCQPPRVETLVVVYVYDSNH